MTFSIVAEDAEKNKEEYLDTDLHGFKKHF